MVLSTLGVLGSLIVYIYVPRSHDFVAIDVIVLALGCSLLVPLTRNICITDQVAPEFRFEAQFPFCSEVIFLPTEVVFRSNEDMVEVDLGQLIFAPSLGDLVDQPFQILIELI